MTYYPLVVAALITWLITAILLVSKAGKIIQDVPNQRSLHTTPTPRVGGVALMAGILAGWSLLINALAWWVIFPLLALFVISLVDDMRGLPVGVRLLAHVAAAVALVTGAGAGLSHIWTVILVLGIVWMVNLYNFMDGSDGLAGGMGLIGFAAYGLAALTQGNEVLATLNFTICAAALGFLFYNFHPAKVFMGDGGSIPLGFLAAAMGIWGWRLALWPAWFPLVVFSPFIVDASITLLKRTLRGAKITEAHREHSYQRLIQLGWGHRKVALVEYLLMSAVGMSALLCVRQSFPWLLFLTWGIVYTGLVVAVDLKWRQFQTRASQ